MSETIAKKFEKEIQRAMEQVVGMTIDRLPDPQSGYKGQRNICDYFGYKYPSAYYIECKSVHDKWFTRNDITDNQWNGLLQKSATTGVVAGYFIWFISYDLTIFVTAPNLCKYFVEHNRKSLNAENLDGLIYDVVPGRKKANNV